MATHAQSDAGPPRPHSKPHGLRALVGRGWRRPLTVLALLIAAITVWFIVSRQVNAERNALLHMDPNDRRSLYEKTRRSAEVLCQEAATHEALSDRCIESTRFLLMFPECDAECEAFARGHQPAATR